MTYIPPELRRILEGRCEICGETAPHPAEYDRKERSWVILCTRLSTTYLIKGEELGKGKK